MASTVFYKRKRTMALLFLALTLCAAVYLTSKQGVYSHDPLARDATSAYQQRDPVIARFTAMKSFSFNENGQLESTLYSPKATHYKSDKQTVKHPDFYSYEYSKASDTHSSEIWHIQAKKASHDGTKQQSVFEDDVRALSTDPATNAYNLDITTPILHIDHIQQTAYSNDHINIISPTGTTQAQSILLQLQSRTVTLENQVKSNYAPPQ